MINQLSYNFKIASESIMQNKLRSILTSLGIIFGVASVISMLAIGSGAEQEILEKMKLLGTNNIIIQPLDAKKMEENKKNEENENSVSDQKQVKNQKYSPGLTLSDVLAIKELFPSAKFVSPEITLELNAIFENKKRIVKLNGIDIDYFKINNFEISSGNNFNQYQFTNSESVCIIGNTIRTKLFPAVNPISKKIKVGNVWLTIIGVAAERRISKSNIELLNLRDFNNDIYIPINSMLLKYANRSQITKIDLDRGRNNDDDPNSNINNNQLDKVTIHFDNNQNLNKYAEILNRLFQRRHNQVQDYEIIVPESLLEQEQNTKRIFNIVLGAIASISLVVGGIGIMNIMLASVLERTKEIGVRKAVGAKKLDIMQQFLIEAVVISLTGGIIGIILGITSSYLIEQLAQIKTIITFISIAISFIVSISVGLIFGIAPARKASSQDPIELLRYE